MMKMLHRYGLAFIVASFIVPTILAIYPAYIFFAGTVTDASVTNVDAVKIINTDPKKMDREMQRVTYSFTDSGGSKHTVMEDVSGFVSLREGDGVEVIYLPSRPSTAMIYHWVHIAKAPMLGLIAPAAVLVGYILVLVFAKAKLNSPTA